MSLIFSLYIYVPAGIAVFITMIVGWSIHPVCITTRYEIRIIFLVSCSDMIASNMFRSLSNV